MDSSSNPPFFVQSSNSAQSEGNAGAGPSGDSYSQALHMQAVPPQRGFGPLVNVGGSKAARAGSPLRDVKLEPGSARPATYRCFYLISWSLTFSADMQVIAFPSISTSIHCPSATSAPYRAEAKRFCVALRIVSSDLCRYTR